MKYFAIVFIDKRKDKDSKTYYNVVSAQYHPKTNSIIAKSSLATNEQLLRLIDESKSSFILNFHRREYGINKDTVVVKDAESVDNHKVTRKLLTNIVTGVRKFMVENYGDREGLYGRGLEASKYIEFILKSFGVHKAKVVSGWCLFDEGKCNLDKPYAEHFWCTVDDIYIDVTADQFNNYMNITNKFSSYYIMNKLPYGILKEEPLDYKGYYEGRMNTYKPRGVRSFIKSIPAEFNNTYYTHEDDPDTLDFDDFDGDCGGDD